MQRLQVRQLSKSFGKLSVLRDIEIDIAAGEFISLLGPSGCGKTTLLRVLAGLERPDSGDICVDGVSILAKEAKDRDFAMVFQSYALYPHLSVADNIALPLRMRRLSRLGRLSARLRLSPMARRIEGAIAEEVAAVADSLEIGPLLRRRPGQLSGGQRQRVALARAMIRRPQLFLLDEPLSNLDAQLRVQLRSEIVSLHRRLGTTFIFVTHDQAEAMTMSDRIAVMLEGRVAQLAAPRILYEDPNSLAVARFLGTPQINAIEVDVDSAGWLRNADTRFLQLPGGSAFAGRKVTAAFRPEHIKLRRPADTDMRAFEVHSVEHLGSETLVQLRRDGPSPLRLVSRIPADVGALPSRGETCSLSIEPTRVLLFDSNGERLRYGPTPVLAVANG